MDNWRPNKKGNPMLRTARGIGVVYPSWASKDEREELELEYDPDGHAGWRACWLLTGSNEWQHGTFCFDPLFAKAEAEQVLALSTGQNPNTPSTSGM